MDPATLADVFLQGEAHFPRPDRFLHKSGGVYRPLSTGEFARQVRACAGALAALGIGRGDRVAILSYNRPEWAAVDYACHLRGAVSVPLYTTLPADLCAFILRDSGARAAFVENTAQKAKVEGRVPHLVAFEEAPGTLPFRDFLRRGGPDDPAPPGPDDPATIIYTSGTSGPPKGVLLTHRNIVSNLRACLEVIPIGPDDTALSFLPLAHAFERLLDYGFFWKGARIAYAEGPERAARNLSEVRPTVMAVVPRFCEKLCARIRNAADAAGPLRRRIFDWALAVGDREAEYRRTGRRAPPRVRGPHALARLLVLDRFSRALGGRLRFLISGGAPLSPEISRFLHALGLTVLEGYGLTETSPVLTVHRPGAVRPGTVGPPIPGVEIRIAPDGEILARGPNVMKEYWNRPEETAEALRDGWFHTGDVGELDPDGHLRITDRKKDLLKTAGGKYIAPQPIEARLKADPRILNAVVVGEARNYPVALVVPAPGVAPEQIRAALDAVNASLPPHERVRNFALLERDFRIEEGELTPTLKVRRRVIERKYADRIRELYPEDPG